MNIGPGGLFNFHPAVRPVQLGFPGKHYCLVVGDTGQNGFDPIPIDISLYYGSPEGHSDVGVRARYDIGTRYRSIPGAVPLPVSNGTAPGIERYRSRYRTVPLPVSNGTGVRGWLDPLMNGPGVQALASDLTPHMVRFGPPCTYACVRRAAQGSCNGKL